MAAASASKKLAGSSVPTAADLAELAAALGIAVDDCHFESNANDAYGNQTYTLTARARTAGDPPGSFISIQEAEV